MVEQMVEQMTIIPTELMFEIIKICDLSYLTFLCVNHSTQNAVKNRIKYIYSRYFNGFTKEGIQNDSLCTRFTRLCHEIILSKTEIRRVINFVDESLFCSRVLSELSKSITLHSYCGNIDYYDVFSPAMGGLLKHPNSTIIFVDHDMLCENTEATTIVGISGLCKSLYSREGMFVSDSIMSGIIIPDHTTLIICSSISYCDTLGERRCEEIVFSNPYIGEMKELFNSRFPFDQSSLLKDYVIENSK